MGLETAFPVLYTKLVKTEALSMERLVHMLTEAPNERFGLETRALSEEDPAPTFTVWDLEHPYVTRPEHFQGKGRSTPFAGWTVYGRCVMTVVKGAPVYRRQER